MIQIKEENIEEKRTFGSTEERSIISLAFDHPDFFSNIGRHLEPEYFTDIATRYVYIIINYHLNKHDIIITRKMCRDQVEKNLTADDPYEEILGVIDRKTDPRELPVIKETLMDWARQRAYSQMYSEEAISSYERGDYEKLEEIIEGAKKITDIDGKGMWFFDQFEELFMEDLEEKLTTGFTRLDSILNEGGPTRKEVVCWLAPTGVGKSIMLVNTSVACIRKGLNVLFVTLELSDKKVAARHAGAFTEIPLRAHKDRQDMVKRKLDLAKDSYGGNLVIYEFAPDDISVDAIYSIVDNLGRMHDFAADVVIIDYLELLLSRNPAANKDDYTRQKRVATEIRGLAKKANVFIATASQSNRAGNEVAGAGGKGPQVIDLNKVAESYGKTMPLDYIITLNQTKSEYEKGRIDESDPNSPVIDARMRFFIAKNRNGPKFKTISARINYETMKVAQEELL